MRSTLKTPKNASQETVQFHVRSSGVMYSHLFHNCSQEALYAPLRWPKQKPALLRRGFPTASSAQADRASQTQQWERESAQETRGATRRKGPACSTAEQSTALLPAHPPPLHRNTQMLACCLSPIHTWGWPGPPLPHRLFLLMICTYYGGVSPGYRKALLDRKPLVYPFLSFWHVFLCFFIFTLPPPTQELHHANQPL